MITALRRLESSGCRILMAALVASLLQGSSALGQKTDSTSKPGAPPRTPAAAVTTLEQFLDRGLKTHPDILVAEAKVESAKAELSQTQFRITRELISLWNARQSQRESIAYLERLASQGFVETRQLIDAKGKLTEIEAQISHLLGPMVGADSRRAAAVGKAGPKRMPEGPLVKKIADALGAPLEGEFINVPLKDVAEFLRDCLGTTVVVDSMVEEVPVTVSMKGTPLHAALQAVEDVSPGVRFFVRDYGILVTSDSPNAAASHMSVDEFWRQSQAKQESSKGDPTQPSKASAKEK